VTLPTDPESLVKLFAMGNQLLENELDSIERTYSIDLGRLVAAKGDADEVYYPQFDADVRAEAARMAKHYEIFYCLEKTIRSFISNALEGAEGPAWWQSARVPVQLRSNVQERIQKELDAGVTPRSDEAIDYTTFGELGELIRASWDIFGGVFTSQPAVTKVMSNLNTLRGPIAHCSMLADDEVLRLRLSVKDWFRLME
jgi:HEPN superfamily Swt1-like protein